MQSSMEVDGLAELEKQLKQLDLVAQKKVLRKATRESAKPIQKKIEQNVSAMGHVDTGLLAESIKTRVSFPKRRTWADVVASVGVFKLNSLMRQFGLDPKKDMPPTVYGWWLEHGTQPHRTGSGAKASTGKNQDKGLMHPGILAKPFIRPAFDSQLTSTVGIQKNVLAKEIDKALKKGR
ncbi:HK97 gp10 family phage protein [uncultured Endozoicomonas sp.]|uniref:HK97 gp10 family phage protein n=1 Tax=uncultured Endozoicomonas sp. TaxID=432652 RepID=UPI0026304E48|nr:HK97 gp10 family phage protein [uncultured Endozoicomonas sp.]